MPVYIWKGRTMAGESQAGEVTFDRQEEAMDFLRKKRVMVTSIKEKSKGFATPNEAALVKRFETRLKALKGG